MNLHKFIRRICAAAVAAALTLSLCTPVLAEGIAALPAPASDTSQLDETGDVPIDPAHFPDENFRKYLGQKAIDDNRDGILSQTERERVKTIFLDNAGNISDLTGIKYFPNLENLNCALNLLTSLDVSNNPALTSLNCNYNQLTSLDLSKNTALDTLCCSGNKLTSLDLSKNTALTSLYCESNQLTGLDLSKNTALTSLYCESNQLTSLDLSGNANLTRLSCSSNLLTSLDVSNHTALIYLNCESNQLTGLDLSKNTALTILGCSGNKLTSLDLSQNTALKKLYCSNNQRQITVGETGQFDLSALKGFDVSKASGWSEGAAVDGNILTVPYGVTEISYQYDLGNGNSETFTLTFNEVKEPDLPDDSSAPADTGSTAGGAIAAVAVGGAAVWGGYELVTRVMLHSLLPEGAAIPASRGQLALLVWNTAGRPEPVNAPAFADVTDPDTARAAQWCVEQGLLTLKKDGSFDPDGWTPKFRVIQVWNKAFPKQ